MLDPEQFFREIKMLQEGGVSTEGKIFIANNTHVITDQHKAEDKKSGGKIGTTGRGNGPAYRDKYGRTGLRAEHVLKLKSYLIDLYKEWHSGKPITILAEGAQGFGLDIDWGDYPFVTSSHCTTAGFLTNGFPPQSVRDVWGVAKMYETYVGAKKFEPDNPIFKTIRELGEEFGATTGRPRQVNWMNVEFLEKAIHINGVTHVVFNKIDIMRKAGVWALVVHGKEKTFSTENDMKAYIVERLANVGIPAAQVYFSESKESI